MSRLLWTSPSLSFSKKGFTLFELMITIAILAILYGVAIGFTQNPSIFREKSVRMQSYIEDQLKSARTDTMIGKGHRETNNSVTLVSKREVTLSGTLARTVYYSGSTSTGIERQISFPFFDNDKNYTISNIYGNCVTTGSFTGMINTPIVVVYEQGKDIKINGVCSAIWSGWVATLWYQVKYMNYTATGELNVISGVITTGKPQSN